MTCLVWIEDVGCTVQSQGIDGTLPMNSQLFGPLIKQPQLDT